VGFLTSPAKCCCDICTDCCNGTIPDFEITITLVDDVCDVCNESLGGTFVITPSVNGCGGQYGGWITPIACAPEGYITREIVVRYVSFFILCIDDNWRLQVSMELVVKVVDPVFGTYYYRNDYSWVKTISAVGVECADVCEDVPLVTKSYGGYGIGAFFATWICDPGAVTDLTCNVCAVPP